MQAKFFCKTGILAGTKYVIDREARIGKDVNNHIVLDTKIVSGQHARIFFDDKEKSYFLEDLQSRNGTRLDGLRVTEAEKLSDLHVITLAEKFDFIFQLAAADGQAAQERTVDGRAAEERAGQKTVVTPPKEAPRQTPTVRPSEATKLRPDLAPFPDLRQSGKTVVAGRPQDDLQKTVPGGRVVMPPGGLDKDATARPQDDLQKTVPGGRVVMPPGGLDKDATARPQDDLQKTVPGGRVVMPPGGFDKDATARSKDDLQKTIPGGRVVMPPGGLDKDATARPKDDLQKTVPGGRVVMPPEGLDKDTTTRPKDDLQKTAASGQVVMPPAAGFETEKFRSRVELPREKTLKGMAPPLPDFQSREAAGSATPTQKTASTTVTFFLEIKRAGGEPTVFTLKEGENTVGRLQDCDIPIDDVSISRQHAVVTVKSRKVMVRDLGSKNRTFIGDRAITEEVEIRLDTRLKFGAVEAHVLYKKG